MNEIISEIKKRGYNIIGLESFQIDKIEKFYSLKLPEDYKFFLKTMGLDGGGFMKGEDCFYDRIFELKNYALELLEDDETEFKLKDSYFVFYSHQGYIFAYFDTSKNNIDPSIYYYMEGDMVPNKKYDDMNSFFKERLEK